MTLRIPRARFLTAALLVSAVVLPLAVGRGQPPAGQPVPEAIRNLRNVGSTNCIRCHHQPIDRDVELKVTEFVRMDESAIWEKSDLHGKAYQVLSGPLGKQMGSILNWDVTQRVECLACHAVNLAQELTPGVPRPATMVGEFHT